MIPDPAVLLLALTGFVLNIAVIRVVVRAARRVAPIVAKAERDRLDYAEVDAIIASSKAAPARAVPAVETPQEHYKRIRAVRAVETPQEHYARIHGLTRPVARRPKNWQDWPPTVIHQGDVEIVYGDPDVIDEGPPRRQQLWLPLPPPDEPRTASGRSMTGYGLDRPSDDYQRTYRHAR